LIDNVVVNRFAPSPAAADTAEGLVRPSDVTAQFGQFLQNALNQVNRQEALANRVTERFLIGEADVHEVTIASQKALIALQLTSQIRNKVIEAYQEMMRMQI
jgi:flagellar hook-basal body complex protein FliE